MITEYNPAMNIFQFADRFWREVDKSAGQDACWPWKGCIGKNGYGRTKILSETEYAHRIAYLLVHGEITPNHEVCHTCDNPPCCNPSHLYAGTHFENIQDAVRKGHMNSDYRIPEVIRVKQPEEKPGRNRPVLPSTTVSKLTSCIVDNVQLQKGLRYPGRALDVIVQDWAKNGHPEMMGIDLSGLSDESGQVSEALATVLPLFVSFIALTIVGLLASEATRHVVAGIFGF